MKLAFIAVLMLVAPARALADHAHSMSPPTAAKPTPIGGVGDHSTHPVSTRIPDAQRWFDQGFRLVYAFNHDEAVRAFERAAQLDPKLAMAHWGIALALGPNINMPTDEPRSRRAYEEVQLASKLAAGAPTAERNYIDALAKRYAVDPKTDRKPLDLAYKQAMGELVKRWPDDLDAATLYAESAMDLSPWDYWKDGKPKPGFDETISVLESVLRRDPDHIGANHYYIHVIEASPYPERALGAARRLEGLAPAAGHLVHMPTHIYLRTGDYERSGRINDEAAAVDRSYIRTYKVEGMYPVIYFNHNLHMAAVSYGMEGRYTDAMRNAREATEHSTPQAQQIPMAEMFSPTSLLIQVRFRRWNDLMGVAEPAEHLPYTHAVWHFGRGMARAAQGDVAAAQGELSEFEKAVASLPADATIGINPAPAVVQMPRLLLQARIARTKRDQAGEIAALRRAVAAEDALIYDEPADWYLHAREALGGALLRAGKPAEAENVFREELEHHPRSGRALYGLAAALDAQKKTRAATLVRAELDKAWKRADTKLAIADL